MPVFTTHALVLRTFPHKESDLIVRLFTEEFGRLSGVARGARRPVKAHLKETQGNRTSPMDPRTRGRQAADEVAGLSFSART